VSIRRREQGEHAIHDRCEGAVEERQHRREFLGVPMVLPRMLICFQKIRRTSTVDGDPVVAPNVTIRPPGLTMSSRVANTSRPALSTMTSGPSAHSACSRFPHASSL